ncbi:hypothetical protein [Rhodococcus sp. WAY2]|uniref:hypothetical protein n=1 Tax=Rhodococcus sp. WAY2 TaxID=2663121 RepID=UPI00135C276E|nr:hypothetical protein [Rhodococcus sp. WAY2]
MSGTDRMRTAAMSRSMCSPETRSVMAAAPVAAAADGTGVFVSGDGVDATVFGASSKTTH